MCVNCTTVEIRRFRHKFIQTSILYHILPLHLPYTSRRICFFFFHQMVIATKKMRKIKITSKQKHEQTHAHENIKTAAARVCVTVQRHAKSYNYAYVYVYSDKNSRHVWIPIILLDSLRKKTATGIVL